MTTVLVDVNGTLVPSESTRRVDPGAWQRFRAVVTGLRAEGITVGLCSDSPLEELREFGHVIGLGPPGEFPVVAENGNVLDLTDSVRVLAPFAARRRVSLLVARLATAGGLVRQRDTAAPEFGGARPGRHGWALGAHRRASVSAFAPAEFVCTAAGRLRRWATENDIELSVDASPHHGFLGVHPYADRYSGKRRALRMLADEGHAPIMIGDTTADWVPIGGGVRCAFVGNAEVPASVRAAAWACSARPELEGAVDLLCRVLTMARS
jgi:hypothetical protein